MTLFESAGRSADKLMHSGRTAASAGWPFGTSSSGRLATNSVDRIVIEEKLAIESDTPGNLERCVVEDEQVNHRRNIDLEGCRDGVDEVGRNVEVRIGPRIVRHLTAMEVGELGAAGT